MPPKARIKPRKLPSQERSKQLVESLLDATAAILVKHGYEGLTTNRVAESAGVSVGSLYQYFPNKEALVAALIQRWSDNVLATITERYHDVSGLPIEEAVVPLVQTALETTKVNVKLHRILIQQIPNVEASPGFVQFNRRLTELVSSWMELQRDQLEVDDLHLAAELVVTTLGSLCDYALLHRPELLDSPAFLRHLSRLMLGYLSPTRASQVLKKSRPSAPDHWE